MHFSVISVFPEFFNVSHLSLLGKAQDRGLIDIEAIDLRTYTHDVHRTVDDSPFGGGAGMVMKADVWAEAIDDQIKRCERGRACDTSYTTVLAIPTPSGLPLTQAMCENLAHYEHIVIACGRYEGIDARIAEYYSARTDIRVIEYSLGDYVLNGGEVAAMALMEAVGRLVPGMIGNPESLVEESYGDSGLLEYPVYTRPARFRGIEVPEILRSGDHKKVARWRKDQALTRTATRRPDLLTRLNAGTLDKADRKTLARNGWFVDPRTRKIVHVEVGFADPGDAAELAVLASRTFPDACPASLSETAISEFIETELSEGQLREYSESDSHMLLIARSENEMLGYVLCVIPEGAGVADAEHGAPSDVILGGRRREGPFYYLSKFYIDKLWRGTGVYDLLMDETLLRLGEMSRKQGYANPYIWLGTNEKNKRAQRAYRRYGFRVVGERKFYVGDEINTDPVMARALFMAE